MQLKLKKTQMKELSENIAFIQNVWHDVSDVYHIVILGDMADERTIKREDLYRLESKLDELKKHYRFSVESEIKIYPINERERIERYRSYIEEIHQGISSVMEQGC